MTRFAHDLVPPYYAVIFANQLRGKSDGYDATAARMVDLAEAMDGYLGHESARDHTGFGITVSYWRDEAAIAAWKREAEHLAAQEKGIADWYQHYELRVAKIERAYAGPEGRAL